LGLWRSPGMLRGCTCAMLRACKRARVHPCVVFVCACLGVWCACYARARARNTQLDKVSASVPQGCNIAQDVSGAKANTRQPNPSMRGSALWYASMHQQRRRTSTASRRRLKASYQQKRVRMHATSTDVTTAAAEYRRQNPATHVEPTAEGSRAAKISSRATQFTE